jgi:hypothetical protein
MHKREDELKKALRDSLLRTHWVLCHPSVAGMEVMAAVHGATYSGPIWTKQPEIQEALRVAGLPQELPRPTYAEIEAGVFKKEYGDVRYQAKADASEASKVSATTTITVQEHIWGPPDPEEAVFLGTFSECYDWIKAKGLEDNVIFTGGMDPEPSSTMEFFVQNTGREIDRGEEAAFFAQFEEEE